MEFDFKIKVKDKKAEAKEIVFRFDDTNSNELHVYSFLKSGVSYEPDVTNVLRRILEPGDVFIDVGANIGYFTMLGSALVGPQGKVLSFEPDPKNIDRIKHHCANNKCENVEIVAKPVSHSVADVNFWFNKSSSGGNALWNPGEYLGDPAFNDGFSVMKSTTLSDEFASRGIENVKLIKIDTEGAEHDILKGAAEWLKHHPVPFIIAELNRFGLHKLGSSSSKFIDFMYSQGYFAFLLYLDGKSPQFICPGVDVKTTVVSNILFTTPAGFARLWPRIEHNPGVEIDKTTGQMRIAA